MEKKLLSNCDTLSVNSVGKNSIDKLAEKDYSADTYLTEVSTNLISEKQTLDHSLGVHRKGEFTLDLANTDERFDGYYLSLKRMLEGYMCMPDEDLKKKAEKVWRKVEARDPYLYKMGYEKEVVSTFALLDDFDSDEIKTILPDLPGLSIAINGLKTSITDLDVLIKKNNELLVEKKNVIAPSVQKNVVANIINDSLMPYLEVMSKVKPDEYKEVFESIGNYIESANTKARAQKTRSNQEEEEIVETEESN